YSPQQFGKGPIVLELEPSNQRFVVEGSDGGRPCERLEVTIWSTAADIRKWECVNGSHFGPEDQCNHAISSTGQVIFYFLTDKKDETFDASVTCDRYPARILKANRLGDNIAIDFKANPSRPAPEKDKKDDGKQSRSQEGAKKDGRKQNRTLVAADPCL